MTAWVQVEYTYDTVVLNIFKELVILDYKGYITRI